MLKRTAGLIVVALLNTQVYSEDNDDRSKPTGKTFAGVLEMGTLQLNLDPIKRIVESDPQLGNRVFDFNRNTLFTAGAAGFVGDRESGARVGSGAWIGYNALQSDVYQARADSISFTRRGDSLIDSVDQIHIIVAYGGFLGEKSFTITPRLRLFGGGMVGAGAQVALRHGYEKGSAFRSTTAMERADTSFDFSVAVAPMWAFDVHGGANYSLTRWMSIGVDAALVMFYSSWGFGYGYGSFFTLNPNVRLRLTFGSAV